MLPAAGILGECMTISRRAFDEAYDELILGRSFVEFPEYYALSRERYWRSLQHFQRLPLKPSSKVLDIGGGQFAILLQQLAGHVATVGDVTDEAAEDVKAAGLSFQRVNLLKLEDDPAETFDCITFLEVIEHLPVPAYVIFRKLFDRLAPGGSIFLTTPNGYRLRNILYMLFGKRILDHYRYPEGDEGMGHQLEYTLPELEWQTQRAGGELLFAEHYDDGWRGRSFGAQAAKLAFKPANLVPHLRNSIVLAARRPDDRASAA